MSGLASEPGLFQEHTQAGSKGSGTLGRARLRATLILHRSGTFAIVDRIRDVLGWKSNRSSYSQFGEDSFILKHLGQRPGIYIDVGANHPFRMSNTYLLYRHGWRGVTVEPIRRLADKQRRWRVRDIQVNVAVGNGGKRLEFSELIPAGFSTFDRAAAANLIENGRALLLQRYDVEILPLTEIYRATLFPAPVDLLSIDTEGWGLDVLRGIDFAVLRPRVIVIEMNGGREDAEIRQFVLGEGYEALKTYGCNDIFERKGG
jgi:FkbM family methyltransferase